MGKEASFPTWLWDLLSVPRPKRPRRPVAPPAEAQKVPSPRSERRQALYDRLVTRMKDEHGIRVRRWRSSTTGCAWQVHYRDGTTARLIEAPYPKGPVSCAVFLHEIGHHAIGFTRYKPRCLEEYMAWKWALDTMAQWGLNITPSVERRVQRSLKYAVIKAQRRGIKNLPEELLQYAA